MSEPDLPDLPDCSPAEDACDPIPEVDSGQALYVMDKTTGCMRKLVAPPGSIVVISDGDVAAKTGAVGSSIILPHIEKGDPPLKTILAQNQSGKTLRLEAPANCAPHKIVGKDGGWSIQADLPQHCFLPFCEDTPTQAIGYVEKKDCNNEVRHCLVRFDVPSGGGEAGEIFFQASQCADVEGNGTEGNPFRVTIKISGDANNCLECRSDGLYVACQTYGGADPLDAI